MTKQQLIDKAYQIATSTTMTEEFNEEQFQDVDCTEYAWQPFEYWDDDTYANLVVGVADRIIAEFINCVQE